MVAPEAVVLTGDCLWRPVGGNESEISTDLIERQELQWLARRVVCAIRCRYILQQQQSFSIHFLAQARSFWRAWIGIEKEAKYLKTAKKRVGTG
jgi:hypothetical protein